MTHIVDIIDLVHPTVSGTSVITSDEVWVLFDREIDESTIEDGTFFVTGRDFDTWSGPDLQEWIDTESLGDEEDILESPELHGIVQGEISFERIELDSLTVVSSQDTIGSGHLFRTKAIFTPTNRLSPNATYTVYITGDEDSTDSLDTGISSRTVFDTQISGSNTGTGLAEFDGGYSGDIEGDFYHVMITTAGEVGGSKFEWWRSSAPGNVFGPLRTKRSGVILSDGVTVSFSEGEYDLGDTWTARVKERDIFTGNLLYPFSTGSGSIAEIPETTSTTVIGEEVSSATGTSVSTFTVVSTTPADQAAHQTIPDGDYTISVNFSADVDGDTVDGNVEIYIEPANGDWTDMPASGEWTDFTTSTDGQTVSIVVPSGVLNDNNIVNLTLDENISSESGDAMEEDYEFWFTTTYSPFYSTVRKVRLEYGVFLTSILDDTIALAIREASTFSNEITFSSTTSSYYDFAQKQWVTCKAAEMVLLNAIGGGNVLRSKRLGDLEVSYNTAASSDALDKALACLARWEEVLIAGGTSLQTPQGFVKGSTDPDRPPVGRAWGDNSIEMPAANTKRRKAGNRRYRSSYSTNRYGKGQWPGHRRGSGSGRNW